MTNLIKRLGIGALALATVGVSSTYAAENSISYVGKSGAKKGVYECSIKEGVEDCYKKNGNGVNRLQKKDGNWYFFPTDKSGPKLLKDVKIATTAKPAKKISAKKPSQAVKKSEEKKAPTQIETGEKIDYAYFDTYFGNTIYQKPAETGKISGYVYSDKEKGAAKEDVEDNKIQSSKTFDSEWNATEDWSALKDSTFESKDVKTLESPAKSSRYSVGLSSEGFNASIDWKLGDSNFRLGPFIQRRDNVPSDTKHDSKITHAARTLVGPGVYRERVDSTIETKETSLNSPEYGVRIGYVLPGKPVEFFATLGVTQKETLENKTLSSDVKFTDNAGNQIGSVQHASKKLPKKHDRTDVAVLGAGASLILTENLSLDASAKTADGKLSILGGAKLSW